MSYFLKRIMLPKPEFEALHHITVFSVSTRAKMPSALG
jgi:hypothetical protein